MNESVIWLDVKRTLPRSLAAILLAAGCSYTSPSKSADSTTESTRANESSNAGTCRTGSVAMRGSINSVFHSASNIKKYEWSFISSDSLTLPKDSPDKIVKPDKPRNTTAGFMDILKCVDITPSNIFPQDCLANTVYDTTKPNTSIELKGPLHDGQSDYLRIQPINLLDHQLLFRGLLTDEVQAANTETYHTLRHFHCDIDPPLFDGQFAPEETLNPSHNA